MKKFSWVGLWRALILAMLTLHLNGCDAWSIFGPFKESSPDSELVVAVIPHALSSGFGSLGSDVGYELDLVQNFARWRKQKTKLIQVATTQEAARLLHNNKVDIALGRLSSELSLDFQVLAAPTYMESELWELCPQSSKIEKSARHILGLRRDVSKKREAGLAQQLNYGSVNIFEGMSSRELIRRAVGRKNTCVILEKMDARVFARELKEMSPQRVLTRRHHLAFWLAPQNNDLQSQLRVWFQVSSRNQSLSQIRDRHLSHLFEMSPNDVRSFDRIFRERFQQFEKSFKSVAKNQGLPWQLLAAVAFQESQLQSDAKSFTGVQGLMQLTQATASFVGISDRLNPEQSLQGGAKYLKFLLDQQPRELHPRDRLLLALAAYNVGFGHLKDAQALAVERGKNPFSWREVKSVLPLLTEPSIAQNLKFGLARGFEPIDFVNRVLSYYDFLLASI
ncbi:MAG: transglycosylase SLT domain-containing protein [Bdellovibrio sp.]